MFASRFIVLQTAQFCRGVEGEELRYTSISPTAASLLHILSIYITVLKESHIEGIKLVYVGLFEILLTDKQV